MSGFTKGKWGIYKVYDKIEGVYPGIESYGEVKKSIIIFGKENEYCGVRGGNKEERIANAYLISAAPDLYEALKEYVNISRCSDPIRTQIPNPQGYAENVRCDPCGKCKYCLAVAALKKAEGRTE